VQVTLSAAAVTRRSDHTPYSFTAPDRRTLLGEGGSAFSRVRGGEHRAEHFTLPGERLAGVPVRRLDDDSLAGGQRERGAESYLCRQIPGAGQQPGFRGFYLLTNAETGKAMTISLWETREQMPAGIRDQGLPATGLTPPQLETYEVTVRA